MDEDGFDSWLDSTLMNVIVEPINTLLFGWRALYFLDNFRIQTAQSFLTPEIRKNLRLFKKGLLPLLPFGYRIHNIKNFSGDNCLKFF